MDIQNWWLETVSFNTVCVTSFALGIHSTGYKLQIARVYNKYEDNFIPQVSWFVGKCLTTEKICMYMYMYVYVYLYIYMCVNIHLL
jgi:hypothetical protein